MGIYKRYLFIILSIITVIFAAATLYRKNTTLTHVGDQEKYTTGSVNFILQSQNEDNSYPSLSREIDAVYDVYYLYYLKQIKDKLNIPITLEELEHTYKLILDNRENTLFPEKRHDNISTIYFFTNIFKDYIMRDSVTRESIIQYILNLQLPNGSFSYSKNNIEQILENERTQYLSTYMALFVLGELGYTTPINQTSDWVKNNLSNLDKYNFTTAGHLLLAIQIARLLNVEINQHAVIMKINKIASEIAELTNKTGISLLVIDPLIDFKHIYPQANVNLRIYKENVDSLQLDDGFFKVDSQSEENILATHIALKYYDAINFSFTSKRDKLNQKMEKYKISPFYLYYQEKPGTLEATYYADKIKKVVNVNGETDYSKFLSKINIYELSSTNIFYYLSLIQMQPSEKETFVQLLQSKLEENITNSSYLEIYYNIKSLELINHPLLSEDKEAISNLIIKTISEKNELTDEATPFLTYYRLLLSDALEISYDSIEHDKTYLRIFFENDTKIIEQNHSVEFCFLFYELLQKYFKDINADNLKKLIEESRNQLGFIKTGRGDQSLTSYSLTYKALLYFKM
jgi:hypothetical protein